MRTEIKLIALGLLSSSAAMAQESAPAGSTPAGGQEPSPWMIGIRQEFTGEDNLFRAPEGSEVRDRISSTGLTLGVNQPIGRQRLSADLQANANRYRNNEQLNNTDYRAAVRFDWETVERISGEVSAQTQRSLYRESIGGTISTERNQLRQSGVAFQARVGIVTLWSFEGGVAASENKYSGGAAVANRDVRQHSANASVRWRPSDRLSTRLGVRQSRGTYPNFGAGADEFTRNDIDLIGSLTPSGASSLDARLSATRERHTIQLDRDSDGWTGALGWNWRPTGKLTLGLDLSRDSSVGRTGFDSSLITADSSDARESQSATMGITWQATAKIRVTPSASFVRRKLDSGFSAGGGSLTATDRTTIVGIGVHYQPITALDLSCSIEREQRKSDSASTLTSPYTANVASCSAQFAMR